MSRNGEMITTGHVVHGAASILAEDQENDVALLAVQGRPGVPDVGESILVVGSPLGFADSASDGIVSAVRQVTGLGLVLQMTAPISSGSSGSPVLNLKGQVIAVAHSGRRSPSWDKGDSIKRS